jgi:acyl transferase domain-containing protein/acyl carrier protein
MELAANLDFLSELTLVIASALKMPAEQLDVDARFDSFGVDSLAAMEVLSAVAGRFDVRISPAQFMEIPTIRELASFLGATPVSEGHGDSQQTPDTGAADKASAAVSAPATRAIPPRASGTTAREQLLAYIKRKYSLDLVQRESGTVAAILEELGSSSMDVRPSGYHTHQAEGVACEPSPARHSVAGENTGVAREQLAIVGMSCRFPNAPDTATFWDNLIGERCSIAEIPPSRWHWQSCYSPVPSRNQTVSKWAALLEDVDCFDAEFFGVSPEDARLIDPQERLLVQEVYHALQDAGLDPAKVAGTSTGIFVGYEYTEYEQLLRERSGTIAGAPAMTSSSPAFYLANRLSYLFDLRGPSEPFNLNCASSAVAFNRACQSLLSHECDTALVAGVSLNLFAGDYIGESQYGLLSANGTCGVFASEANGFTRGEGVGVVVLKRLRDTQASRDRVYAIVRGCHQNNRGRAKTISDISHQAITDLLRRSYEKARVEPESIRYIEVDGYCTKWGDSFEFEGIKNVFTNAPYAGKGCALGSVKGNIGHLEPASGIASVVKIALSMYHKRFPATLTGKVLNEFVDFESTAHPLYMANRSIDFVQLRAQQGAPVRAGINSFSDSGCNIHIVLEEFPQEWAAPAPKATSGSEVFVVSAKSAGQLQAYVQSFIELLVRAPQNLRFTDLIYTLQTGRESMAERLAIVADSCEDLLEKLKQSQAAAEMSDAERELLGIYRSGALGSRDGALAALITREMIESLVLQARSISQARQIATLWARGVQIPWEGLWSNRTGRIVSLPGYPFSKQRCWLEAADDSTEVAVVGVAQRVEVLLKRELAQQLSRAPEDIPSTLDFLQLETGSHWIAGWVRRLNDLLDLRLSPGVALKHGDIQRFSRYLAQSHAQKCVALLDSSTHDLLAEAARQASA